VRRAVCVAFCVGAVAVGAARVARAAPSAVAPELTLTWHAPGECPTAADVEKQFATLLGGPSRAPTPKRLEAVATVWRGAHDGWVVHLETTVEGAPGQRTLEGDSCRAVAAGAALILALTIDPSAAGRAAAGPPEPAPAPPPAPPVVSVAPPRASPVPPPSLHLFVRAFSGAVVALLPETAFAGGLAVGVKRARLSAELGAWASQQRRGFARDVPGTGGDFRVVAVATRGCGLLAGRPVGLRLCVGVELERLSGDGFGVDTPGSGRALLLAGQAGAALTVPISSRFELSLGVSAAGRPYHPAFVLDNIGRVFRVPALSAFADLAFTATF
jgi:hypothetical protein